MKYFKFFMLIVLIILITNGSYFHKTQLSKQSNSIAPNQFNNTNDIYQEYDLHELRSHIPKSVSTSEIIDIHTMYSRDLHRTVMEAIREINPNMNIGKVRIFVNSENTKMILSYQNDYGYNDSTKLVKYDFMNEEDKKLYENNSKIKLLYNRWVIIKKSFYDPLPQTASKSNSI